MKNKILKKVYILIVMMVIIISNMRLSTAVTKTELNNQQSEIDKEISKKEDELEGLQAELTESLREVQNLTARVSEYENEISALDDEIEELEGSISARKKEIEKKEKEQLEQETILTTRIVAMYESGGQMSYLELLLSSKSLTGFLSNYYLMSEITEMDEQLLQTIENTKKQIEAEKEKLEEEKEEIEATKEAQVAKANALKVLQKDKQSKVAKLNSDEKKIQSQLDELEEDKKKIQKELERIFEEEKKNNGSYTVTEPSKAGYIFPVEGLTRSNINNTNFPSYAGHTGIDVNINVVGRKVVAVKAGTVEISTALRRSDGSYRSYGEYIVINHHDGTMTLYGHGLAGSRLVQPGQQVKQGQPIMTVGSTGNSSGPHLHFEVWVNRKAVNPMPYLP